MTSGGKREGAGKPALPEDRKRKNITLRLAPETIKRLSYIRAAGYQPGRVIDDLVEAFCKHAELEPDSVLPIQN